MMRDYTIADKHLKNTLRLNNSIRESLYLAFVFGIALGVPVGYVVKSFFG